MVKGTWCVFQYASEETEAGRTRRLTHAHSPCMRSDAKIHVSVRSSFNFSIFHLLNVKTLTFIYFSIYQLTIKFLLFLSYVVWKWSLLMDSKGEQGSDRKP